MAKPAYKNNEFASTPTSMISTELIKYHKPLFLNRNEKKIVSKEKNADYGIISFEEIHKELNEYSLTSNREIIEQFKSIGLSREEFQIFLAIFDLFVTNGKDDYEKPVLISLKDFHNHILDRKNRLRKSDIDKYISTFSRISSTFIKINTDTASIFPYKRKYKSRLATIYSSIANIAIISMQEYDCDIIKIFPSEYFLYEISHIAQISNYLPRDFIKLNLKSNDNILFFGHYLVKMHNINSKIQINNLSTWETFIPTLINNALPDYDSFMENYELEKHKSQYIDRHVFTPLKNSLAILKNNDYITGYEFSNINTKYVFDNSQKLQVTFKYKETSKIKKS